MRANDGARTVAKRKTLFDDRTAEINELTYIIKQDLSKLNNSISSLQALTPQSTNKSPAASQQTEHAKNVVFLLQGKVTDVAANFKDVLETRTQNLMATKNRTQNFVSSVSSHAHLEPASQSASPLYSTPARGSPASFNSALQSTGGGGDDLLSLAPPSSDQQLLLMEEGNTSQRYIQQRSDAIVAIESTISELGSIFGQLATMVSEQSEMIQRIDQNTEDVVDNVAGAQRELLKYWGRVSGNRWLVAKMFGVLMIFFL